MVCSVKPGVDVPPGIGASRSTLRMKRLPRLLVRARVARRSPTHSCSKLSVPVGVWRFQRPSLPSTKGGSSLPPEITTLAPGAASYEISWPASPESFSSKATASVTRYVPAAKITRTGSVSGRGSLRTASRAPSSEANGVSALPLARSSPWGATWSSRACPAKGRRRASKSERQKGMVTPTRAARLCSLKTFWRRRSGSRRRTRGPADHRPRPRC